MNTETVKENAVAPSVLNAGLAPEQDHISLKWGTLKAWHLHSDKGRELLKKYFDLGASSGAMTQHDTQEQKELICQMIDECNAELICLDWDGVDVSKDDAKKYVRDYGR
jgi:hypothetical protein